MSIGKQLLDELRKDGELRKALAEELLPETLRYRALRKTMLLALSREMATKDDIENLRKATKEDVENLRKLTKEDIENLRKLTKEDIENLRKATREDFENLGKELKSYIDTRINDINVRINDLNTRISDLYGVVKTSLVAIVVTLASTILVPLMLKIFF